MEAFVGPVLKVNNQQPGLGGAIVVGNIIRCAPPTS
jgi:hypothetical protein